MSKLNIEFLLETPAKDVLEKVQDRFDQLVEQVEIYLDLEQF